MGQNIVGYVSGSDEKFIDTQIETILAYARRNEHFVKLDAIFIDDTDCKDILREGLQGLLYHFKNNPNVDAVVVTSCSQITENRWDFPWGIIDLESDREVTIITINRDILPEFLEPRMLMSL